MAKKKNPDDNDFDTTTFEKVSSDTFDTTAGTYKVSLPFLPAMEIESGSAEEACEMYNKLTGVLSTINRHEVTKIK